MNRDNTVFEADLTETGADLRGHFLLTTGYHSPRFFLMARLGEYPERMDRWAEALAQLLHPYPAKTLVGAALGGIIPAYATAAQSHRRVLIAEKTADGRMALPPNSLESGEPVIVIEDAVATGSSIQKVMRAVETQGGVVVAIGALVHRGSTISWPVPYRPVFALQEPVAMWTPECCPLCRDGVPLTKPKT
ncbi:phosphoribosyltransferase family protein [Sulfobacillus harzensis]|uniref:Orotate phosphoribosyltransferase n=1 Tax=Sulfobacillus harzensis TaxID=2729629 RepID=A0A7Y0L167_9FIRM|nr:phosphoribosyltransferase family protein [Sulfobacillus harzensis]NMP21404.1 orotate phosphoribosyltransferase [Sulfobacillus harzensis]